MCCDTTDSRCSVCCVVIRTVAVAVAVPLNGRALSQSVKERRRRRDIDMRSVSSVRPIRDGFHNLLINKR